MSRWGKIPNHYVRQDEVKEKEQAFQDEVLRPLRDRLERHPVADDRNWDEAMWDDKDQA